MNNSQLNNLFLRILEMKHGRQTVYVEGLKRKSIQRKGTSQLNTAEHTMCRRFCLSAGNA